MHNSYAIILHPVASCSVPFSGRDEYYWFSGSSERGVNEKCLKDSARAPPFEEDCHVTTQRTLEETPKKGNRRSQTLAHTQRSRGQWEKTEMLILFWSYKLAWTAIHKLLKQTKKTLQRPNCSKLFTTMDIKWVSAEAPVFIKMSDFSLRMRVRFSTNSGEFWRYSSLSSRKRILHSGKCLVLEETRTATRSRRIRIFRSPLWPFRVARRRCSRSAKFTSSSWTGFLFIGKTHSAGRTLFATTFHSTTASSRSLGDRTSRVKAASGLSIPAAVRCLKTGASWGAARDSKWWSPPSTCKNPQTRRITSSNKRSSEWPL